MANTMLTSLNFARRNKALKEGSNCLAKEVSQTDRNRTGPVYHKVDICRLMGRVRKCLQERILSVFVHDDAETETANWQEWTGRQQNELLAFSVHMLLPHIRIFLDENNAAMAALLDQELRKGWSDGYSKNILLLKREIIEVQMEASGLLTALEK